MISSIKFYMGLISIFLCFLLNLSCSNETSMPPISPELNIIKADSVKELTVVIHTVVALCDNKNQGIVKVPEALGNGQEPKNNLYWGAMYGLKTYLTKKENWEKIYTEPDPAENILEEIILFKNYKANGKNIKAYLIAEAWDGKYIEDAIEQFLNYSNGLNVKECHIQHGGQVINIRSGGSANMLIYIGHDGLMEFDVDKPEDFGGNIPEFVSVFACKSRKYFRDKIHLPKDRLLLLTNGYMAPEAYSPAAAINQYVSGHHDKIHQSVAEAYDKYQKCGLKGAKNLFHFERIVSE